MKLPKIATVVEISDMIFGAKTTLPSLMRAIRFPDWRPEAAASSCQPPC